MKKNEAAAKAKSAREQAKREKLAVKHWRKLAEARVAELEMCGLPGAARVIAKIIRRK